MAATPSNSRLRLTPSNSPYLSRPSRSPLRGRTAQESKISLKRVIGTTCNSPTGFDAGTNSFAYIAGAAVVVVDVEGQQFSQRFFRARPSALPIYPTSSHQSTPSTPVNSTPKANDSRGRIAPSFRDSTYGPFDGGDSPSSRTWTSRERIKAATCLSLSRDGKYLAVGETGYAPRVLVFNLQEASSSDIPLVSISEHAFGVKAVAWSPDGKYLASLGAANDGFLYIWRIDPRTGAARLFQQNRCTSFVKDMIWMGHHSLVTLGVRHVKIWKIDDGGPPSPSKSKAADYYGPPSPSPQRTLSGRNVLLGSLLDATFSCAAVDGKKMILCTEAGDVCIVEDDDRQARLTKVLSVGFSITTVIIRRNIAYVGGRDRDFATLDVEGIMDGEPESLIDLTETSGGLLAMGFLKEKLVTIDSRRSIDIWSSDYVPGQQATPASHTSIPGHGDPIMGVRTLERPNKADAAFLTWSQSGNVTYWDLNGQVKFAINIPVEEFEPDDEVHQPNQMMYVQPSKRGKHLVTADREGMVKVTDVDTKQCFLDTRAHSADCISVSVYEDDSRFVMATCGRDRTVQLFSKDADGNIQHFQTVEFNSRVVQVLVPSADRVITCSMDRTVQLHDIVSRDGDPETVAAIPVKVISLRASPTSMALSSDGTTIFVSLLDRSFCSYDLTTGRQTGCFKCIDEGGIESAVMESLSVGQWIPKDMEFLLGASNTDKSIRIYDANAGTFLDREWGHTEAINGVTLLEDDDGTRKMVSVGSDGTIMIWTVDLNDPQPRSMSRDPSPVKEATSSRPTLRRVLSKAELAEFQRPQQLASGRRSPPRTIRRRTSRFNLAGGTPSNGKTPPGTLHESPSGSTISSDTPSRRPSADAKQSSPPPSPRVKTVTRRPSLPALGTAARKKSNPNLRAFGTLNMSTEQACRTLRAYRKKLISAEPISPEVLTELDQELRLTAAALGDRAIRSKAMNETVLSGLLDQYSERLVTLLDEKLRLTASPKDEAKSPGGDRRRSGSGDDVSSTSSS